MADRLDFPLKYSVIKYDREKIWSISKPIVLLTYYSVLQY